LRIGEILVFFFFQVSPFAATVTFASRPTVLLLVSVSTRVEDHIKAAEVHTDIILVVEQVHIEVIKQVAIAHSKVI